MANLETLYITSTSWLPADTGLSTGQSRNIITSGAVTSIITGGKYSSISKGTIYCIADGGFDLVASTGAGAGAVLYSVRYQNSAWTTSSIGSITFSTDAAIAALGGTI